MREQSAKGWRRPHARSLILLGIRRVAARIMDASRAHRGFSVLMLHVTVDPFYGIVP